MFYHKQLEKKIQNKLDNISTFEELRKILYLSGLLSIDDAEYVNYSKNNSNIDYQMITNQYIINVMNNKKYTIDLLI